MEDETALPTGDTAAAGEQANTQAQPATQEAQGEQQEGQESAAAKPEGVEEGEDKPEAGKKEKTAEQREIERLRRRVDNTTKHKHMLQAELEQLRGGNRQPAQQQGTQGGDDEPVTLSRAEMQRLIAEQAQKLAPTLSEQQGKVDRQLKVVDSLTKAWGAEEFNAKAMDLELAVGGLADASGRQTPVTEAIFEADDPAALIEYLSDPDNADAARQLGRLPAVLVGREIARIEAKLEAAKKQAKPEKSSAARPIEPLKGGGAGKGMPDPANTKAWIRYQNERESAARR